MGLFSKRTADPAATTTGATTAPHHYEKNTTGVGASHPNAFINQRPTVGAWFKNVWIDLLTMAAMGAIGLGIYKADPAPTRNFPVFFRDGQVVYPEFAYPLRDNIIPIWAAALLASLVPIFLFVVMQIRIKSFWDLNNATFGVLYSLICAAVFQVFIKWLIGGLRPHFLAVCKPDLAVINNQVQNRGVGFDSLMYDRSICTGDKRDINDSLESMPSGHSTAAGAGFVFLFLYLNAKLKLWSNYHPRFWKMIAVYAPLLAAVLIASSLTIDEFHNWYDCLVGLIIGTICAFGAYRMVYASIWDWRINHIPLPRGTGGSRYLGGSSDFDHAVFTRKAGFGTDGFNEYGMGSSYYGHNHHFGRRDTEATIDNHHHQGGLMSGGPLHNNNHHNTVVPPAAAYNNGGYVTRGTENV